MFAFTKFYFWILVTIIFIAIDQLTKYLAQAWSWLIFFNDKFAFSLPVPTAVMYFIYIVVLTGAAWYVKTAWLKFSNLQRLAWSLIFAGGLSNVVERIVLGHVRDFIDIANGMLNIADFFVLGGAVLLLITSRVNSESVTPAESSEKF